MLLTPSVNVAMTDKLTASTIAVAGIFHSLSHKAATDLVMAL
jgi:hypothetical protein